jgi:putative DNA primase/helicase
MALSAAGAKIGRMTLRPVKNAAIKIDHDTDVEHGLVVSEGLETGLAGRMLGFRPCWSLGSAGAIGDFRVLPGITSLTVLVDHDPGKNGKQAGPDAAAACSVRWRAAGVEVIRIVPRRLGADVADIIKEQGGSRHAAS